MAVAKVLDSWALLCYLEREPGFEKMIELFEKAVETSKPLLMCIVNWGEVYYHVARRHGEQKAREIERFIETLPITLIEADKSLTREAARTKTTKRMAYADCFAAATALRFEATVLTGDPEFKKITSIVPVEWL